MSTVRMSDKLRKYYQFFEEFAKSDIETFYSYDFETVNFLLNTQSFLPHKQTIVDFGSGAGKKVMPFKGTRKIICWDASDTALAHLKKEGFETRKADFNILDESKKRLDCHERIKDDLRENPVSIFFINVLQYLTPEAHKLMLICVLLEAKPGSVFVIHNHVYQFNSAVKKALEDKKALGDKADQFYESNIKLCRQYERALDKKKEGSATYPKGRFIDVLKHTLFSVQQDFSDKFEVLNVNYTPNYVDEDMPAAEYLSESVIFRKIK